MKKLFTLLLLLPSLSYAQQKDTLEKKNSPKTSNVLLFADQQAPLYMLKDNGKMITKFQVDSLKAIYKNELQYGIIQDEGKVIIEIGLPDSGDEPTDAKDASSNKSITFSTSDGDIYKDTSGNIITMNAFRERINSGKYTSTSVKEGDKTILRLLNKAKYDKETAAQLQAFKNKLINSRLPDFQMKTIDGKNINLATLKGKVIVMNFWFIGCKPCIEEIPLLNDVVAHYKNNPNILFLAPALDAQDKLIAFYKKHSFSYQALASAKEFNKKMNVNSYPTHMIIDAKGLIKDVMLGGSPDIDKTLIKTIDKIADN